MNDSKEIIIAFLNVQFSLFGVTNLLKLDRLNFTFLVAYKKDYFFWRNLLNTEYMVTVLMIHVGETSCEEGESSGAR